MKTNEILENIKARRSVRAYTGQQVSEEDLQAVLEAATYAPSGMHLETWHFTAIQNADKLTELNQGIFCQERRTPFEGTRAEQDVLLLLSCSYFGYRFQ